MSAKTEVQRIARFVRACGANTEKPSGTLAYLRGPFQDHDPLAGADGVRPGEEVAEYYMEIVSPQRSAFVRVATFECDDHRYGRWVHPPRYDLIADVVLGTDNPWQSSIAAFPVIARHLGIDPELTDRLVEQAEETAKSARIGTEKRLRRRQTFIDLRAQEAATAVMDDPMDALSHIHRLKDVSFSVEVLRDATVSVMLDRYGVGRISTLHADPGFERVARWQWIRRVRDGVCDEIARMSRPNATIEVVERTIWDHLHDLPLRVRAQQAYFFNNCVGRLRAPMPMNMRVIGESLSGVQTRVEIAERCMGVAVYNGYQTDRMWEYVSTIQGRLAEARFNDEANGVPERALEPYRDESEIIAELVALPG